MALLTLQEHKETRKLWEEVFEEDTKQFLDYYDQYVADHNQIFVEKEQGEIVSMVQLNPYRIRMGKEEADSYYIVAVATRESCRHQGRMRRLLTEAMESMRREQVPFTFLMPASEDIYRPFDFVTVYRQSMFSYGAVMPEKPGMHWECVPCRKEQLEQLAKWSNHFLEAHSQVSTVRSIAYYEQIWEEQKSMNGEILLFYEGSQLKGYCFSGYEGSAEGWELAVEPECRDSAGYARANRKAVEALTRWFAKKEQLPVKICGFLPGTGIEGIPQKEMSDRPMTMVRIIDLEALITRMRASREICFEVEITDPILKENNGTFQIRLDSESGTLTRTENRTAVKLTISELAAAMFGALRIEQIPQDEIRLLKDVYLNELV